MKTMSLGEVNLSTTEFTHIKMSEEILQAMPTKFLTEKELKGSRTETEKEVSSVLSENHRSTIRELKLIKNSNGLKL